MMNGILKNANRVLRGTFAALTAAALFALPNTARAEETPEDGTYSTEVNGVTWYYSVVDGQVWLGWGRFDGAPTPAISTNTEGVVSIPSSLDGLPVAGIGWDAFNDCAGIETLHIPAKIARIDPAAFDGCTGLTNVVIDTRNRNFRVIDNIIYSRDLKTLVRMMPSSELESFTISNVVTRVDDHAFYGCEALAEVEIPQSVQTVGDCAFHDTALYYAAEKPGFEFFIVGDWLCGYFGSASYDHLVVVGEFRGIADYALCCGEWSYVTIGDNVETIGADAFWSCYYLAGVDIGSGVSQICDYAFESCESLMSVIWRGDAPPEVLPYYGATEVEGIYSYASDYLVNFVPPAASGWGEQGDEWQGREVRPFAVLPEEWRFIDNRPEGISYSDGVLEISKIGGDNTRGVWFFSGGYGVLSFRWKTSTEEDCDFAEFRINDETVKTLSGEKDWTEVKIRMLDNSTTKLTFCYSKDSSVDGGEDTVWFKDITFTPQEIECHTVVFKGGEHGEIAEGEDVQTVIDGTGAVMPRVTADAGYIFTGWDKDFSCVTDDMTVTALWEGGNRLDDGLHTVEVDGIEWRVLVRDGESFLVAEHHGVSATIAQDTAGAITVPCAFGGCPLVGIIDFAFCGCTNLTSVTLPPGVAEICEGAFMDCTSLSAISIPDGVKSINNFAFRNCAALGNVRIPSSLETLGCGAFAYCNALDSLTVSEWNLNFAGDGDALYTADGKTLLAVAPLGLSSYAVSNSVETIAPSAFMGYANLAELTIPGSVLSIGQHAFTETALFNAALESGTNLFIVGDWVCGWFADEDDEAANSAPLVLPAHIRHIADEALIYGDWSSVPIPDSVASIGAFAFQGCSLSSATVGSGVARVYDGAFSECSNLESVFWRGDAPAVAPAYGESKVYGVYENSSGDLVNYVHESATGWGKEWQERPVVIKGDSDTFTVTFEIGEHGRRTGGGELRQTVAFLGSAVAPEVEATDDWTFVGWSDDFSRVSSDMNVAALWIKLPQGWSLVDGAASGVSYADGVLTIAEIGDDNTRGVEFETSGAGTLTFQWKVSSEPEYDWAKVFIDDEELAKISGEVAWTNASYKIDEGGTHRWKLCYIKDVSYAEGEDAAWFKDVVWTPKGESPIDRNWLIEQGVIKEGDPIPADWETSTDYPNGHTLWDSYVAGLSPTNAAVKFTASIEMIDGVPNISWSPNLNKDTETRTYKIWGAAELGDEWAPATPAHRFFKVTVDMPKPGDESAVPGPIE